MTEVLLAATQFLSKEFQLPRVQSFKLGACNLDKVQTLIIAEAGVNHNGSRELALRLVDAAVDSGADVVKFQTFLASELSTQAAKLADYQKKNTGSDVTQQDLLRALELSQDDFRFIKSYCDRVGIEFLSTAFDFTSLNFLKTLEMKRWKIPSGEITNLPYLESIAELHQPIILSTGMSDLVEVENAVNVIKKKSPNNPDLTLLHCTTEYPTPFAEVNLKAMPQLGVHFSLPFGYSDHTLGIEVPIAAVALGAKVIEKHLTLDRQMVGPDHRASLEPHEFKKMVQSIRNIENALGSTTKIPTASEIKNREIARKSIVASRDIKAGETMTEHNLTTKRPGTGINPMKWYQIIGQASPRSFLKDEVIEL